MEVVSHKVADDKGKINNYVDGKRQDTFDSYASFQHSIDQTLLAVGSRLREPNDHEAKKLQRTAHAALRKVASYVEESYVSVSKGVDKSFRLTVGHARNDESARLESSTTHLAILKSRRSCDGVG